MNVHLIAMKSDIVEDNYENGELDSTGCGYRNEAIGRSFGTTLEAIGFLAKYFGFSPEVANWEISATSLRTSRLVANHTEAQNGGWLEPTEHELRNWRRGLTKLYEENVLVQYLTH